MAALASDLKGGIVGGVALDLDGAGGEVIEVLVQELHGARRVSFRPFPASSIYQWLISSSHP